MPNPLDLAIMTQVGKTLRRVAAADSEIINKCVGLMLLLIPFHELFYRYLRRINGVLMGKTGIFPINGVLIGKR